MGAMNPTDVEFRVVGEDRWAPFKRWLMPKILGVAVWLVVFAFMFASLMALRWLQGAL